MLTESPTVDALRLAAAMRRRFPEHFHATIERALWEAIADFWAIGGGHFFADGSQHILAPLPPIYGICAEKAMALSC